MNKTSAGRYTFAFAAVLVIFILINAVVGYYNSQEEFFAYDDYILNRETLLETDRWITSWNCSEYVTAYEELTEEYAELEKYCRAVKILSGERPEREHRDEFTIEEAKEYVLNHKITSLSAQERMRNIEYIKKKLEFSINYNDYISGLINHSEEMSFSGIFSETEKKQIIKSKHDYYGHENLQVSAETDEGFNLIFSDTVSDIFACLAAVICAFMYSVRCRIFISRDATGKSRFRIFSFFFAAAVVVIYINNIYSVDMFIPVGNPGRALQSLRLFYYTPYMITAGTFLVIRILIKTAACLTVFYIFTAIFSAERKVLPLCILITAAASETAAVYLGADFHFITEFSPEQIFSDYRYVVIFGEPVNSVILYLLMTVIILLVSMRAAGRMIKNAVIKSSEIAEQQYFEEINNRYNESRMIRHDLKNHISVISMLLDNGDTEGIRKYIGDLSDDLDSVRPPVKTGSGVLDALLFRKMSKAAENRIKIETEFLTDFSGLRFTDYDLCGIFSNILDNAIEACIRCSSEEHSISLTVKEQMDMICIFCENPFREIRYSSGNIVTLKTDSVNHGLGLKRIKQLAARYNGTVDIKTDNNIFSISVLLVK